MKNLFLFFYNLIEDNFHLWRIKRFLSSHIFLKNRGFHALSRADDCFTDLVDIIPIQRFLEVSRGAGLPLPCSRSPGDHQNQHMFYAHYQCEAIGPTKVSIKSKRMHKSSTPPRYQFIELSSFGGVGGRGGSL